MWDVSIQPGLQDGSWSSRKFPSLRQAGGSLLYPLQCEEGMGELHFEMQSCISACSAELRGLRVLLPA